MRILRITALGLMVACGSSGSGGDADGGSSGDPPALFTSGARLHAVYTDGGAGAVQFEHWRDTELDIDCRFDLDPDGQLRCLPGEGAGITFLDADCTEAAFAWTGCAGSAPPPMVAAFEGSGCADRGRRPYQVGSSATVTRTYSPDAGGTCAPFDLTEPTTFYRLTPVELTRFAAASERTVTLDGDLGVVVRETEGGAGHIAGMVNTAADRPCTAVTLGADSTHCLHLRTAIERDLFHSDDTCAAGDIAFSTDQDGCPAPEIVLVRQPMGTPDCPTYQQQLASLGDELAADQVYFGIDDTCTPATGGERYWSVGAPATDELPVLQTVELGDGRLRALYLATPAGVAVQSDASWWDDQLGAPCEPRMTTAGVRCLPPTDASSANDLWADDQCTQPVISVAEPACGPIRVPTLWATVVDDACDSTRIDDPRTVGVEHTGPVYTSVVGCELHDADGYRYYLMGPPGSASFADYPEIVTGVVLDRP